MEYTLKNLVEHQLDNIEKAEVLLNGPVRVNDKVPWTGIVRGTGVVTDDDGGYEWVLLIVEPDEKWVSEKGFYVLVNKDNAKALPCTYPRNTEPLPLAPTV